MNRGRKKSRRYLFGTLQTRNSSSSDSDDETYCPEKRVAHAVGGRIQRKKGGNADWSRLPPELWMVIFDQLIAMEGCRVKTLLTLGRVCSAWRALSKASYLWRSVVFTLGNPRTANAILEWMAENRFQTTQHLNLTGCKASKLGCLVKHCSQLVALGVTTVERFLQFTKPLTKLTISPQCSFRAFSQIQPALLKNLTHLRLCCTDSERGPAASFTIHNLPALQDLALTGFVLDLAALVQSYPKLEALSVVSCRINGIFRRVDGLVRLKQFLLSECIFDGLYWGGNGGQDGEQDHLWFWLSKCQNLSDLYLTGILQFWQYMDMCSHWADWPFPNSRLESLYLCNSEKPHSHTKLHAASLLEALLSSCHASLRSLEVKHLALYGFKWSNDLPNLHQLQLTNCSLETGVCLAALEFCPNLSVVNFASNYALPRGAKQTFLARDFDRLRTKLTTPE